MEHDGPYDHDLTIALRRWSSGNLDAEGAVIELLVTELRGIAAGYARGQRPEHTLQATALVNEAFLRLCSHAGLSEITDRGHFFRVAARSMRQILVDHARRRTAAKRGGRAVARLTLHEELAGALDRDDELIDLDQAVDDLAELDPRQARVVELRFFCGLEVDEVAAALDVSRSTVEREWRMARAWLGRRLGGGGTAP